MKLSKRQINALNRSGRAEYDARLGDLLGETLNKGIGAIIVETDGSVPINDAMEGVPFENIIIVADNGTRGDTWDITISDGKETKIIPIYTGEIHLRAIDGTYDEINLGLGVYIQRIYYNGEEYLSLDKEIVTPLPDETLKAFAEITPYTENMTVTCEGVSVKVSYVADTKKYIDEKVAEMEAIILESQVM